MTIDAKKASATSNPAGSTKVQLRELPHKSRETFMRDLKKIAKKLDRS
jgi:hypothetical protein